VVNGRPQASASVGPVAVGGTLDRLTAPLDILAQPLDGGTAANTGKHHSQQTCQQNSERETSTHIVQPVHLIRPKEATPDGAAVLRSSPLIIEDSVPSQRCPPQQPTGRPPCFN